MVARSGVGGSRVAGGSVARDRVRWGTVGGYRVGRGSVIARGRVGGSRVRGSRVGIKSLPLVVAYTGSRVAWR